VDAVIFDADGAPLPRSMLRYLLRIAAKTRGPDRYRDS